MVVGDCALGLALLAPGSVLALGVVTLDPER